MDKGGRGSAWVRGGDGMGMSIGMCASVMRVALPSLVQRQAHDLGEGNGQVSTQGPGT